MKEPEIHGLISRALRRELTAPEEVEFERLLRENPSFRAEWELERALDHALATLPDAPVSTNFTSLVLQAATRESSPPLPARRRWFQLALPRFAATLAGVVVIGFAVHQQRQNAMRRDLAEAVNTFSDVAYVVSSEETPPTEIFENFEAIQRLSLPAESELDIELLVALQK